MAKYMITKNDCLDAIQKYINQHNHLPTVTAWINDGLLPHSQTIIRRFGTWKNMLKNFDSLPYPKKSPPYEAKNAFGKFNPQRKDAKRMDTSGIDLTDYKIYLNNTSLFILKKIQDHINSNNLEKSETLQDVISNSLFDFYLKLLNAG